MMGDPKAGEPSHKALPKRKFKAKSKAEKRAEKALKEVVRSDQAAEKKALPGQTSGENGKPQVTHKTKKSGKLRKKSASTKSQKSPSTIKSS